MSFSSEEEVLWQLFRNGPTYDGDVVSKSGRDALYEQGYLDRYDGYQFLTAKGVRAALALQFDRRKERYERDFPRVRKTREPKPPRS